MTLIIGAKSVMPTFTVREPKNGPPIFRGDFFEHPTYVGVIVEKVEFDDRCAPPERIVTYRAATQQDLLDHGF